MDLGSNFVAKLEPFLLMSKSAKGAAAAKLIQDATSAPGVFVFAELLDLPNIQELANHETHSKHFQLLQLFSYKTYQDYVQNKDAYPALNKAQLTKLKHLSLVSLASDRRILPYSELLTYLDMPGIRELEDLIIDAIYLDVLRGTLDQKQQRLEVVYSAGRDLAPDALPQLLAALNDWASTSAGVLSALDAKLAALAGATQEARDAELAHQTHVEGVLKDIQNKKSAAGAQRGQGSLRNALGASNSQRGEEMMMDVDMEADAGKGKGRKGVFDLGGKGQRKRNRL